MAIGKKTTQCCTAISVESVHVPLLWRRGSLLLVILSAMGRETLFRSTAVAEYSTLSANLQQSTVLMLLRRRRPLLRFAAVADGHGFK